MFRFCQRLVDFRLVEQLYDFTGSILISHRIKELFVLERNRRIKASISSWQTRPSSVFCVSAIDYTRNSHGYRLRTVDKFPMSPELTEIPTLKRFVAGAYSRSPTTRTLALHLDYDSYSLEQYGDCVLWVHRKQHSFSSWWNRWATQGM